MKKSEIMKNVCSKIVVKRNAILTLQENDKVSLEFRMLHQPERSRGSRGMYNHDLVRQVARCNLREGFRDSVGRTTPITNRCRFYWTRGGRQGLSTARQRRWKGSGQNAPCGLRACQGDYRRGRRLRDHLSRCCDCHSEWKNLDG
jgi:hypothetical protein